MAITEKNIVQHIQDKNEEALQFIIAEYGGLLMSIIRHHMQDQQQEIEECLDDVLLSVWNHIHSFDPSKSTFKMWIAAIAKYKAIDYLRKRMVVQKRQIPLEYIAESRLETTSKIASDVEELLQQLSPSERTIFEKYYLEGTSSKEIANEFQVKQSWVHNKLSRGRKKLRNLLIQNHRA